MPYSAPALQFRRIPDNLAVPAWTARVHLTPFYYPIGTDYWQYDSEVIPLDDVGLLDNEYLQVEFERDTTAEILNGLVGDMDVAMIILEFFPGDPLSPTTTTTLAPTTTTGQGGTTSTTEPGVTTTAPITTTPGGGTTTTQGQTTTAGGTTTTQQGGTTTTPAGCPQDCSGCLADTICGTVTGFTDYCGNVLNGDITLTRQGAGVCAWYGIEARGSGSTITQIYCIGNEWAILVQYWQGGAPYAWAFGYAPNINNCPPTTFNLTSVGGWCGGQTGTATITLGACP